MINSLDLRKKIEQIDIIILKQLAARLELCQQMGVLKREQGHAIVDMAQEKKQFELYDLFAKEYDLDPGFIKEVFSLIISHSRRMQMGLLTADV